MRGLEAPTLVTLATFDRIYPNSTKFVLLLTYANQAVLWIRTGFSAVPDSAFFSRSMWIRISVPDPEF
jgi:hypothetical protein